MSDFDLFAGWPSAIAWGAGAALVLRALNILFLGVLRAVHAAGEGAGERLGDD